MCNVCFVKNEVLYFHMYHLDDGVYREGYLCQVCMAWDMSNRGISLSQGGLDTTRAEMGLPLKVKQ